MELKVDDWQILFYVELGLWGRIFLDSADYRAWLKHLARAIFQNSFSWLMEFHKYYWEKVNGCSN